VDEAGRIAIPPLFCYNKFSENFINIFMRIAIQASDLDSRRIDGTRVYLLQMLNRFGKLSPGDDFFIFHKKEFNPELSPRIHPNYKIIKKPFPFYWTQTRFAMELWRGNYDALWMPMQALPFVKRKKLKTTVTIHDLAFKIFPQFFPRKDLRRLNLFSDYAIKNSNKIIAVSQSTKNDILKFYPGINEKKIKVIYHGFDSELFQKEITKELSGGTLKGYGLENANYILYAGAIQPRKNLGILIEAFEKIKKDDPELKLVLAGGKAWMWEEIFDKASKSIYAKDIIITGTVKFEELKVLYENARVFVFPSLYEGFGMPVLEAFAAKIPLISAKNSSLTEVGGEAVLYFNENDPEDLSEKIKKVIEDDNLRNSLIQKGLVQLQKFSWDKCAKETLEFIKL
jgi:glycosyltransferase involved in cell wall biosynthesis